MDKYEMKEWDLASY